MSPRATSVIATSTFAATVDGETLMIHEGVKYPGNAAVVKAHPTAFKK
jgi:hypothetical protein